MGSRALHGAQQAGRQLVGKVIEVADSKRPKGGAQAQVAAHITQSREVIVISRLVPDELRFLYSTELVLNMYQKHMGIEQDYKGLYFCAYGSSGYGVGLSVSVDIVQLLLSSVAPPFGLNLSITLKGGVKGTLIEHLLLLIHRAFPKGLNMYDFRYQGTDGRLRDQYTWHTTSPICFMTLQGWEKRIEVSVGFEAGLSVGLPSFNIDGHSLELNLANFEIGLNGGCRLYHLKDPLPGWYPHIMDQRLEQDFYKVSNPNKEELKRLINQWRKYLRDDVFKSIKSSTNPQLRQFQKLLDQRLTLDLSLSRGVVVHSSQKVLNWLNNIEWHFNELARNRLISISARDWQALTDYLGQAKSRLREAKFQANWSSQTGEQLPRKGRYNGISPTQLKQAESKYCRADITVWAFGAQASAKTGGSASQEISLGQFYQTNELADAASIGVGLNLGAGTEIKGNARFMSSRYQTQAPSSKGKNLIFTQDAKVTYTQVVWSYSAGAGASLPFDVEIGYTKAREKLLKNDMHYYSATGFWQEAPAGSRAALEEGSGLSLGTSISLNALAKLRATPNPPPAHLKRYPYYLGLNRATFLAFVNSIPASLFDPAFMTEHPYILLESNFRFINQEFVVVNTDGNLRSLCHQYFGKFGTGGNKFTRLPMGIVELESVRCRVRLGDELDQTRSAFKLGLQVAGIGAGIEIEKIQRAGNMFVEDLYIWDVSTPYFESPASQQTPGPVAGSPPVSPAPDRDRKVPPTVLLPHTFQID